MRKDFEHRRFRFNHVFKETDDQETVFDKAAVPILDSVMSGYNGCLLAYGQTGTGKTHTILGNRDGLLPESLNYLFKHTGENSNEYVIEMSCLQIYMENVRVAP